MRMIPGVVEICERVARLSPDALILNLTNPLSRICQGIANRTRAKFVGLCHEIHGGRQVLSRMLGVPEPDLRVRAAGTNHFTWFTSIRDNAGNDLLPRVRETLTRDGFAAVKSDRLLVSEIFRVTGTYCVTNDSHAGEYFRYGHRWWCKWTPDATPHPFYEKYKAYVQAIEAKVRDAVAGKTPIAELMAKPSGEEVVPIIEHVFRGDGWCSDAINIPNRLASIPQLPPWAIVEVPGFINGSGGHGSQIPDLPRWVIAECHRQCMIHDLTVDAAMDGNRQAAIEALLIDAAVPDPATAEAVFDALFAAHRKYLPRWA
jgi:alpha-galactosidase